MRTASGKARFLAAVTLAASTLAVQPAAADVAVTTIAFRVVEPDGSTVRNPLVVVSFSDIGPRTPLVLKGTLTGDIVVPVTHADPALARRLADREVINLMIRVFDKTPGSQNINSAYVAASVGIDSFGVLRELSHVSGKTFMLEPNRTKFELYSGPNIEESADDSGEQSTALGSEQICTPPSSQPFIPCNRIDFPPWVEHVLVPIAYNHGAGIDFVSELRYNDTIVTQMSVAMEVGAGFFRTAGEHGFSVQNSSGIPFSDRGPSENYVAHLDTQWQRERSGWCYDDGSGVWCQYETTYSPVYANGARSDPNGGLHDTANPLGGDCWAPVDGAWEPAGATTFTSTFYLELGPSETWAVAYELPMYANTKVTQQTFTTHGYVRAWRIVGQTKKYHYVFIPALFRSPEGGCVRHNVSQTYSHATDVDFYRPVPELNPFYNDIPAPPNEGTWTRPICRRLPDYCD